MFFKDHKITGEIGYHHLENWWLSQLSPDERRYIVRVMGKSITEGQIEYSSASSTHFLWTLSTWFNGPKDRAIGRKILLKAEEEAQKSNDPLDMHFTLSNMIEVYYRDREKNDDFLRKAMESCMKQIKIQSEAANAFKSEYPNQPLPMHVGYKQLVIVLEKNKQYEEAIRLCEDAKENGWAGGWDKRIERCKRKRNEAN